MSLKSKIEPLLLQAQKPARYIGGELGSIVKDIDEVDVRFAFCFPDSYDIGMSHLGMKILYSLTNNRPNYWCERVFAPWPDFEHLMRENDIPLYGLESLQPISEFDFVGFTMQYELSYTNVLNMLDLAGIPVLADKRTKDYPIIVAGGPCICNPEPLADFFDIFILGEGEEVNLELLDLYNDMKKESSGKHPDKLDFLKRASHIQGIYVPLLFRPTYKDDGTILSYENIEGSPSTVKKRVISNLDNVFYPEQFVVPFTEIVHDRAVVEVLRGCIRGCRFCQAGFIYRPFREKSTGTIFNDTKALCESTGYEEVSLASLSTSDHSDIEKMLSELADYTEKEHVNLALPSMRIDNFSADILAKLQRVRKSGLTFAPEAGTQRLRDVINKNVTEDEIFNTCKIAFAGGVRSVKLYFMMGLPTETDEDILGMSKLAQDILELYYQNPDRKKGREAPHISISVATFVPKPFTPFQFVPQILDTEIKRRQKLLLDNVKSKKINVSWHDPRVSILEAVLARADRRVGKVILRAWQMGCKFDSWDEYYNFSKWQQAFQEMNVDMSFYANRERDYDEAMPWDHLDYLVTKKFLIRECEKAIKYGSTTPNCKEQCAGCGINREIGGDICGD